MAKGLSYVPGDALEDELPEGQLYYLALPSSLFCPVAARIKHPCKLIVEKPFETDFESAQELNKTGETMVVEQWKDVIGYEGYYQVSNLGRVRSVDRVVRGRQNSTKKLKGRILQSLPINGYGYLIVNLYKNGTKRTDRVHQLVARAWIGPCPNGQQVRHGPNGKLDNSVFNLCYGTRSEDGLDKRRDGTHGGRPVRRSDGIKFINMHVAAEETGCRYQHIWAVCNGQQKTAGGYGWEYIEDRGLM